MRGNPVISGTDTDGVARARRLLARPGAWIEGPNTGGQNTGGPDNGGANIQGRGTAAHAHGHYGLRTGPDRRARVAVTLDETAFGALVGNPGLKRRAGGGWCPATLGPSGKEPDDSETAPSGIDTAGRPGVIDGERLLIGPDGRLIGHRANLGESPIAWLARRKDAAGRPWLTPAEVCAGERLRADAERAAAGPSLTMRWDALPRAGGGSSQSVSPGDAALSASRRVEAALNAVSPRVRSMLVHVCIRSSSLQLAEQALGLRRRQGKTLLKQGLDALADHYRIGSDRLR